MNAGERRIIHKFVERDRSLRTLTIGEGEKKRIVIFGSKHTDKEAMAMVRAARPKKDNPKEQTEPAPEPIAPDKTAKPKPRPPRNGRPPSSRPRPKKEKTEVSE
jgi:hypothetical protein